MRGVHSYYGVFFVQPGGLNSFTVGDLGKEPRAMLGNCSPTGVYSPKLRLMMSLAFSVTTDGHKAFLAWCD